MKKIFCICLGIFHILLVACSSSKKYFCAKEYMSNHKFTYIVDGALTDKYFILKGTLQLEYLGNNVYAESTIIWNTCYDYSLIVKRIYYKEQGLQPSDTLSVKIQSIKNDTLECIASAYKYSFPIKILKSNKSQ